MPSHFVFVDETGSLGRGGTPYFGYGIFEVAASEYWRVRRLLAEARTEYRIYRDFELDIERQPVTGLFQKLTDLSSECMVRCSGLYIDKHLYGGRYLTWSDVEFAKESDWAHHLRNYLLRVALEHHYEQQALDGCSIDLILDRISVNVEQHRNLEDYIANRDSIPRREPFRLPRLEYLTISDSRYTGALQVAHLLANVVKAHAKATLDVGRADEMRFVRVLRFAGASAPSGAFWRSERKRRR